ncbi:hypothetical protein CNY89_10880, partial [Amaricoccus sp. HAR-UPW-R2A-40]
GSLMNNSQEPPSWSHHEYSRHRQRARVLHEGSMLPETLILCPAPGSEAMRLALEAARRVYDESGLSEEEREQDMRLQRQFLAFVRGEMPDFAHAPAAGGATPNVVLQNRLIGHFADKAQLREEIHIHLLKVRFSGKMVVEAGSDTGRQSQMPEPEPPRVKPTSALLGHLAPPERPAGLCVVAPLIAGFPSAGIAEAVAAANPWGAPEVDQIYDAKNERIAARDPAQQVLQVLRDIGASQYGVQGDDVEQLCQAIARAVSGYEEPDMLRIVNLDRGPAATFLAEVWPKLEKKLGDERRRSGNAGAGVLLILASDQAPSRFKALCQEPGPVASFDKPFLLAAETLELPRSPGKGAANTESFRQ